MKKFSSAAELLKFLDTTYNRLHARYEDAFWISNMGDHGVDHEMNAALVSRDTFRSNKELKEAVESKLSKAKGKTKEALLEWNRFFYLYQTPDKALPIRKEIADLESEAHNILTERKTGYVDPASGVFTEASRNKMSALVATHPDEAMRKACFLALDKLPYDTLSVYIKIVNKRNEYAQILGYDDFYSYKLAIDQGLSKDKLFSLFDRIYEKTKYAFKNIRALEKEKPALRKPWNFYYMMTGDFTQEEDPYFNFSDALMYWGKSFALLGVDFAGGEIVLDLLNRQGKHDNGFCHWPRLVRYEKGKRIPGKANFTSNAIVDQIGSGAHELETLFHEGGHAAHFLNSTEREACINTEYPPASVSWAETQSMFMDTISSSIEWRMRYARNKEGKSYPFELFERKAQKIHPLRPLGLMSIIFVSVFEKEIYETKHLTEEKVLEIARRNYKKYFDRSEDCLMALNVPHIYSWENSAYYHGYGLAELGVFQWRKYFFKKYGYIVDNPNVGKEMKKVWKYAAKYPASKFVTLATGKPLGPEAYLEEVTLPLDQILVRARERILRLKKVPQTEKPIDLKAKISLVHGKQKIADNRKGFEAMAEKYAKWLLTMAKKA